MKLKVASMAKTWRLQGESETLVILQRADSGRSEESMVETLFLSTRLDRLLSDPFSRKTLLDMYESVGGPPIRAGRPNQADLTRTVKPHLEKALRRGDLVVVRLTRPTLPAAVAATSSKPAEPSLSQAAKVGPSLARTNSDPHWILVRLVRMPDQKVRPKWWPKSQGGSYISERFSAEFTDGNKNGSLSQGMVRFDDIPAGKIQVHFKDFYEGIDQAFGQAFV